MTELLRVVLADDHVPTRTGVRMALEGAGFVVVAEARDADGAVAAVERERPDICLLDISMPGDGIEAARRISAEHAGVAIVMLTVSERDEDLFNALRAGADGYLHKTLAADRLPQALRGVVHGEAALPRVLVGRLVSEFRNRSRFSVGLGPYGPLAEQPTPREREVLDLMLEELTTGQIAARLGISEVTVRRHISSIVHKAGAPDRRAVLRLLRDAGEDAE